MGGNALKVFTERKSVEQYNEIVAEISVILNNNNIGFHIIQAYNNKDSFGDLDVLIKSEDMSNIPTPVYEFIELLFKPQEIYHNGSCYSFDWKNFQIDFILVPKDKWETSKVYYSYNDLGNIQGRIAYNMGLSYGDYGLKFKYTRDSYKYELIVSRDTQKIFEFLGFSYERYLQGFDNLEDIFKYVTSSKYFNKEIFDYEQLNHQNKTRNKKRKTYKLFLEYIESHNTGMPYLFKSKNMYTPMISEYFDVDISSYIQWWDSILVRDRKASSKFNGNLIIERYPHLEKEHLGKLIELFKKEVLDGLLNPDVTLSKTTEKEIYKTWILNTDQEEIYEIFDRLYNYYFKTV